MKILILCPRIPFPLHDGGNIAMNVLAHSLHTIDNEIKMLALNTQKHYFDAAKLPLVFQNDYNLESVPIDTSIKLSAAFLNLFKNDSYNVSRFYSPLFAEKIKTEIVSNDYDIIQFESLLMSPYMKVVRANSKAKCVLRAHNVEHVIWKRLAMQEKSYFKKKYLTFLAHRLMSYEIKATNLFDGILPITNDDLLTFKKLTIKVPTHVAPVGIDIKEYSLQKADENNISLFHIGSMDWLPNLEGVEWFVNECWPMIIKNHTDLKLHLAGRAFPQKLIERNIKNIICDKEVKDAKIYMQHKPIMIVPLFSGGGMRVKIIEGMALGKCIISTTIGAEGIDCTNNKNILIANTPAEFAEKINWCIHHPHEIKLIGLEARKLIETNYSIETIGKNVSAFYKELTYKK